METFLDSVESGKDLEFLLKIINILDLSTVFHYTLNNLSLLEDF